MKIIECPRDAMQGLHDFIPTTEKVRYLNTLLQVGFDTLDFGSFVSPKAIPQMRDMINVVQSKQASIVGRMMNLETVRISIAVSDVIIESTEPTFQKIEGEFSQIDVLIDNIVIGRIDTYLCTEVGFIFDHEYDVNSRIFSDGRNIYLELTLIEP